ncbi:MAG: M28 family peptidase, partial [Saprospiraceae bacterium]
MRKILLLSFNLILSQLLANQLPSIVQCNIIRNSNLLELSYEVSDSDNSMVEIQCNIYYNSGIKKNKMISIKSIIGDIGYPVLLGPNKKITIELTDLADLNADINIILSAYDREKIDISEILNQVSTTRINTDLLTLQGKRNEVTDKAFKEQSRLYIINQFGKKNNLLKFESKIGNQTNINIESTQWGTRTPDSIQIVDAHYDSYNVAPGADDNASGVIGVLEVYRILNCYASNKTIKYVFFDLEESGLIGSNLYINNQVHINDKIENVINYEMIGYYTEQDNTQDLPAGFNILFPEAYNEVIANNRKGNFITNVGNTNSKKLIFSFSEAAKKYVPNLKVINLEVPGTGTVVPDLRRSDHANFWDKGLKALMITDGANFRNKNYHTFKDSAQYLNLDFMASIIKTTIATLIELAGIEHGCSVGLN